MRLSSSHFFRLASECVSSSLMDLTTRVGFNRVERISILLRSTPFAFYNHIFQNIDHTVRRSDKSTIFNILNIFIAGVQSYESAY